MNKLGKFIISGLGTGYLPIAPGTWASAATCVVFLAVAWGSQGRWYCVSGTMAVIAAAAAVACVAAGPLAERIYGQKDPSQCTLDEWAGQAITLLLLPLGAGWAGWLTVAAVAFVAFRLFDIIKPPSARALEKLPKGWGVLLDDIVAGIYANFTAQLLLRFWLLN